MTHLPKPDLTWEEQFWNFGISLVAGLDEAGRGAWAGPVSAGAVILPCDPSITDRLSGVRDSKKMTPSQRRFWAAIIQQEALSWGVGMAAQDEIDTLGIVPATRLAMCRALDALTPHPQFLLIDAISLPMVDTPQQPLIKGDSRCLSISAASVLAKVSRDAFMVEQELADAGYGFDRHKGYGTRLHRTTLEARGVSPLHRRSFAPIRKLLVRSES